MKYLSNSNKSKYPKYDILLIYPSPEQYQCKNYCDTCKSLINDNFIYQTKTITNKHCSRFRNRFLLFISDIITLSALQCGVKLRDFEARLLSRMTQKRFQNVMQISKLNFNCLNILNKIFFI